MAMRFIEGKDGLRPFIDDPDKAKAGLARTLIAAAKAWREAFGDISFSPQTISRVTAPTAVEVKTQAFDLRQQTLELLLNNKFREPTTEEMELLEPSGYDIVLSTEAKLPSVVIAENKDIFWTTDLSSFIDASPNTRGYLPPALAVALRSKNPFLENSFNKSQAVQLQLHQTESENIQRLVPSARNIMLPLSVILQLDLAFLRKTGEGLFKDCYTRVLDETSATNIVNVGRVHPSLPLVIQDWSRDMGFNDIGTLSAVVFLKK